MSQCIECRKPMHHIDAQQSLTCRNCARHVRQDERAVRQCYESSGRYYDVSAGLQIERLKVMK